MRIDIVSLFPGMFEGPLTQSIVSRAREKGAIELGFVDPRAFADDRRGTVDDRPFGGGPGMVLMAEPLYRAIKKAKGRGGFVVHLTPRGKRLDQRGVRALAAKKHLVLVCGHYEGVDERVTALADAEVSLGDFVLTGGEIPAMAVVDAVARLQPGVLKKPEASALESFSKEEGLLEAPQFTRPRVWRGKKVPDILLSGDHARIAAWKQKEAMRLTRKRRPDLVKAKLKAE